MHDAVAVGFEQITDQIAVLLVIFDEKNRLHETAPSAKTFPFFMAQAASSAARVHLRRTILRSKLQRGKPFPSIAVMQKALQCTRAQQQCLIRLQ
jgi:hypothetical protein